MRIQYGHILTLVALCVATQGSSLDIDGLSLSEALEGLSGSDYLDELNSSPSYDDGGLYDRLVASALGHGQVGHDYEYVDHGSLPSIDPADLGLIPSQPDEGEADMSAVPDMSTVPKASGSTSSGESQGQSQDNQGFRPNTMLPAYCDPPNPCPIGYTTADGCIEDFENSSEFSRGYQSNQKCICDTEHMFDCPDENAHRGADDIATVNILANDLPGLMADDNNPYLGGQKLPVAAKKGNF